MKPYTHAKNSANKWGGEPEEYLHLHNWFDQTKSHIADMRHRVILHNSFGIYLLEQVFGTNLKLSNGKLVSVRDVGEQHVQEDLGLIPTLADCVKTIQLKDVGLLGAQYRKHHIAMED